MSQQVNISQKQAKQLLWRKGVLSWLLDKNQLALYEMFHKNPEKVQTWLLARRSGKSFTLCVLAIEYCIKNPNAVVKFVSPNKLQVERNIRPLINQILETCPEDIKPEFRVKDGIYFFPNKAELQLAGSDKGNIDSVRGGFAHIAIIDEAQDVTELKYAVNSVLIPTTLTTKGKVLISGTPPKDPDHDFLYFIELCENRKTLVKRTIYDNPRLTKEDIEEQIRAMNGAHTEDFRREFMCEILKSKTRTVIPEFDEVKEEEIVKTWEKPPHYDAYVGLDVGGRDWTVALFAYFDFKTDKLVIEDEIVYKDQNMYTPVVAKDIENMEISLWTNPITNDFIKPRKRVSDHNVVFINDIKKASNYKIIFENADKKDKPAAINFLRTLINANKIIISPRCVTLISHLKNAKWLNTSTSSEFGHCPEGSHYDAVDALLYLVRSVDFKRNPYPKDYSSPLRSGDAFYSSKPENADMNVYKKLLGMNNRKAHTVIETKDNKLTYKKLLGNK